MADITVRIECADVFARRTDVLVLKFAQNLYGVDREIVRRLGLDSGYLPAVGANALVPGGGAVGAAGVLFLGVPPLHQFDYGAIRVFGRRAIAESGRAVASAVDLCLTLHGANTGLDETEAFESELAGVIDAVTAGEASASLRGVTFVEHNVGRADRMKQVLDRALPGGVLRAATNASDAGIEPAAADRFSSVGFDSGSKAHVFVAMPFSAAFEDVYQLGIVSAVHANGLLAHRMDKAPFVGDIVAEMRQRIADARLFIADVTGANPNVYLEIGFAWGSGVPTLLVCKDVDDLHFDVRGHRCLSYINILQLREKLTGEIGELLATTA